MNKYLKIGGSVGISIAIVYGGIYLIPLTITEIKAALDISSTTKCSVLMNSVDQKEIQDYLSSVKDTDSKMIKECTPNLDLHLKELQK